MSQPHLHSVFLKRLSVSWQACVVAGLAMCGGVAHADAPCSKPLYLTFDTGHMGVAPLIADVLNRQHVKVTFFAANEPTKEGDGSLGEHWAPSHTFDHVYWRSDLPRGSWQMRPTAGPSKGQTEVWTSQRYCDQLQLSNTRLEQITGVKPLPLFRAPGGKTSPSLLTAAKQCGFAHVGWADAGFLGDELPSDKFPSAVLLQRALNNIRAGDILMAHLGIWSRQDPWAPAVLEPLIEGLKAKGFCFATLKEHPQFKPWIR
jgi:peptidoglycan/xylan/chitin deacetylase (PgdA/CDA1 family)